MLTAVCIGAAYVSAAFAIAWGECKADSRRRFGDEFAACLIVGWILLPIAAIAVFVVPCEMFFEWVGGRARGKEKR